MYSRLELFFVARPYGYIFFCFLVLTGAYLYKLRTEGIFSCPADGYTENGYLAYCNATGYGDYDHGAFWFGLEPEAHSLASSADVLFLGSSRMQFAFSTMATSQWFSSHALSYYLLGFSHTENMMFLSPVIEKIKPHAKVYIINVDRFFDDRKTQPYTDIHHENDVSIRYRQKKLWQYLHNPICRTISFLCGNQLAFYRYHKSGEWKLYGTDSLQATGVADGPMSDRERWMEYAAMGKQFVSKLAVRPECVVLTIVPSSTTKRAEAESIATALGLKLVSPKLQGLQTFDSSHLDPSSAELWSKAFMESAGENIIQCIN